MATKSVKSGSELSQVVIMTLFITSGFLAVSCLVFSMVIPSRQAAAEDQRTDLMNLVKMFRDDKPDGLKSTRDRLKQFERQGDRDKNLRQVVEDKSKGLPGLVWSSFPATNSKSIPKAKTTRHQQSIDFKDAGMQDSLYLIARVRKTRPGFVSHFAAEDYNAFGEMQCFQPSLENQAIFWFEIRKFFPSPT